MFSINFLWKYAGTSNHTPLGMSLYSWRTTRVFYNITLNYSWLYKLASLDLPYFTLALESLTTIHFFPLKSELVAVASTNYLTIEAV